MIRTDAGRTKILDSAPTSAPTWEVLLPHPLLGKPLSEQITDAEADAYADRLAPAGFARVGSTVQGRDKYLNRVVSVVYVRHGAKLPHDLPVTVTVTPGS